jgi:2-iminobutanoate/2-iminopropanoate deaminase
MARRTFDAPGAAAVGPYSHAAGGDAVVFLSGQTPLRPGTTELVTGGIGAQTLQCLENLGAVLAAAGLTTADVVKCNVFLTDMADFAEMNAAYASFFDAPHPARTTIGVAALPLGASVEIEMVAMRPAGT